MAKPTIGQLLKTYRIIASMERMKTGRPGDETVANAVRGTRNVCAAAGIGLDATVDSLTRRAIDSALVEFLRRGLSRISAWSYVCQLRAVFARWCRPYYADAGWDIPALDIPAFRAVAPRYLRPSGEMLARVKRWYGRLSGERWFAATMMLEFAMRNGDVLRLRSENFTTARPSASGRRGGAAQEGRHYLFYVPHKTALTSGRSVFWPIHDSIWRKFEDYGGLAGFDVTDETFDELNRELRSLGFVGSKGCYELRKICIDHVYQNFGAEAASSISGDDIKTITRFYADPSAVNVDNVRIVDLL